LAKVQFEKSQALYEQSLEADPENDLFVPELVEVLLDKEANEKPIRWAVLKPTEMKSEGGATLTLKDDGSILASGKNPDRDVYTLVARPGLDHINAIRLEALPDPSLPRGGPGRYPGVGNFHLNELRAFASRQPCPLTGIVVAYDEVQQAPNVIDGKIDQCIGWSNYPRSGEANTAIVTTSLQPALDDDLKIELHFSRMPEWTQHNLGRFRLSITGDSSALVREQRRFAAMKLSDPWAKLATAYHLIGDQQSRNKLLERRPAAAAGLGELYAADHDWERAIAAYRRAVTDQTTDAALLAKLATAYQEAGRTREAVPVLASALANDSKDTLLLLKVAALQAWFGQNDELAVTCTRALEFAKDTQDPTTAERTARVCSLRPSDDRTRRDAALALARRSVELGRGGKDLPWFQMALGMAEYRSGHFAEAAAALEAAADNAKVSKDLGAAEAFYVSDTSAFYRAMGLFRQGKKDEAEKLATEAAAKMVPLPRDERNPLSGGANHNDLIL
jgi:tetratricopeptide (TPR) repeat protein